MERPDLSQLIPPLPTNTQGVHRLLAAFRSGTSEIKNLLSQECNVILECKICQNMFRSLPNFISHKRAYCLRPAPPLETILHNNKLPEFYSSIEAIESELGRKDIDQIAKRLCKTATNAGTDGVRGENPEASQNVAYYTAIADTIKSRRSARIEHTTILAPIPGTSQAVSQTLKTGVTDDEEKVSELSPPDKKKAKKSDDKSVNAAANTNEGVKSVNNVHSKSDKNKDAPCTVLQYPCPLCKKVFSKPNGAYRHIRDIHKKNNDQLERMKKTIRKKAFSVTINKKSPGDQSPPPPTQNNNASPKAAHKPQMVQSSSQLSKTQQEELKEWNDHTFTIDVGDHRCGYCGTKYERRAALLAHAKQCCKKSKFTAKKPTMQVMLKSKGASNRKISAPMKIVRKYLMSNSKTDAAEERNRLSNGVKSPLKNLRRSTRANASPSEEPKTTSKGSKAASKAIKTNMFPTIPLTRVKVPMTAQVVTKSPPTPKPPVPIAPLQSPLSIEKLLKRQKSSVSNILVRQVSDKTGLTPTKVPPSPVKEPPAVASITPMLSVKPKDGYPVNYFSPGSAETKLISTGNSVPSSIQIRKDYKKSTLSSEESVDGSSSASVCSDKTDDCVDSSKPSKSVISPNVEPLKGKRPILNFDQPIVSDERKQKVLKAKELVEAVKKMNTEAIAEENVAVRPSETCKVCVENETQQPEAKDKRSIEEEKINESASKNTLTPQILKQATNAELSQKLKNSTKRILAVPVSSLDKIPKLTNMSSAIKLKLSSDLLSGISKVVIANNAASSPSPVVNLVKKKAPLQTSSAEATTPSTSGPAIRDLTVTPSTSTNNNVPEISKIVPEVGCEVESKTAKNNKMETIKKEHPDIVEIAVGPIVSKDDAFQAPLQSEAKRLYPNLNVPDEYLIEEDEDFRGWPKNKPLRPLALIEEPRLIHFCKFFEKYIKEFEEKKNDEAEKKIVIEMDFASIRNLKLPPGVKVQCLKN